MREADALTGSLSADESARRRTVRRRVVDGARTVLRVVLLAPLILPFLALVWLMDDTDEREVLLELWLFGAGGRP